MEPALLDQNVQDVVVLNLQRACEQTIDLANWLCSYRNFDIPRTSQEVFTVIEREGVLSAELSLSMRKMVGFRNIAVHEYEALNPDILRSIINTKLSDFEGLIGSISRNLGINTLSEIVPISFDGTKVASFTLKSLSITGDDLGKDYTVSLSLPDNKFSYPIEIQTGQTIVINRDFANLVLPTAISELPLEIHVKESDPVYNDIGIAKTSVKVSGPDWVDQLLVIQVEVSGSGPGERKRSAKAAIEIEVLGSSGRLVISDVPPYGWVVAQLEDGSKVPLHNGLTVSLRANVGSREVFEVLEGFYKGKIMSIGFDSECGSHLSPIRGLKKPCMMTMLRKESLLIVHGLGSYPIVKISASDSWDVGTFPVCLPDFQHKGGGVYRTKAKHADTWFRVGDESERYIHPGRRTKGCITVKDIYQWESIYQFLIHCRADNHHIGFLEVL
jgi:uncharacterized protein YutE (UPF0331/DUF86 family)